LLSFPGKFLFVGLGGGFPVHAHLLVRGVLFQAAGEGLKGLAVFLLPVVAFADAVI